MKKKALLASILTIALCFGAIAGSTYALFTESTSVNIAVTSADLEILAYLSDLNLWSAKDVKEYKGSATLTKFEDEYGSEYYHADRTAAGTFTNGGYAVLSDDGSKLTITNITPGDKVGVKVNINNTGNVSFKYRYVVTIDSNSDLANAMVFTNEAGDALICGEKGTSNIYYSGWSDVVSYVDGNDNSITEMLYFELPVNAGNAVQAYGDTSAFRITIEAVQGNAATDAIDDAIIDDGVTPLLP